jgi:sulfur carrier protein ThiS
VLRRHLTLETGELRPHVLCLVNGTCLDRAGWREAPLEDGDEILIHQAISGG